MYSVLYLRARLLIFMIFAIAAFSCNHLKSDINKSDNMEINWVELSTKGIENDLSKGVSAAFAAIIDDKLIVTGGANFPGKLGFEGGTKAFYDEIFIYDDAVQEWSIIGNFPSPIAYGVSVNVADGALWMGGNNADSSFTSTYYVSIDSDKNIKITPFIDLPVTMDNFSGSSIGDMVFVAGGVVDGKPSNSIYCINIKTDSVWTRLPNFPGTPRVQPVLSSIEMDGDIYLYLMGGFFGGDENLKPSMATDILKYDVKTKEWSVAGEQIDPESNKPFSLGGATAMSVENRYILCMGGVNYDIFLDAITSQYNIGFDSQLSPEQKRDKNLEFSKFYMTQPVEYYKFNHECRVFDTLTGKWTIIDNTTDAARAGATLVYKDNLFYVVQGELKPGVRSAKTFKGEIR